MYEQYFGTRVKYVFLDEIQSIKNWQNIVRNFENMGYNIFISGSSSKLLSKELSTALRGRTLTYSIFPFSFREFLRARGFLIREDYSIEEIVKIRKLLKEYLSYGSFPEVVLKKEKDLILKEYKDLIFFKDFIERFNIENIEVAKFIFEFLLQNFSKEVSVNKISNFVTQKLKENKKNMIYNYVNKLEDTFLFFFVEKYHLSIYKRKTWPKKVYTIDTGLSRFYTFKEDKSKLMENIVFLHLKMQENHKPMQQIYFYKTKNNKEIDFLIKEKDAIRLVDVCYDFDEEHEKKLIKAMKELNLKESVCVTWDKEIEIESEGRKIKLIPLWKWLLKM